MRPLRPCLFMPLLLVVTSCGGQSTLAAGSEDARTHAESADKVAIAQLIDQWHVAAARADEGAYFGAFAKEAVFLGTDATERWDVPAFRAYAHPHFAKGKAWTFRAARRAIRIAAGGDIAWFDEDLETPHLGPARGSGVVVREDGRYKIAQYNLSVPIPNERFEAVRRVIAGDTR